MDASTFTLTMQLKKGWRWTVLRSLTPIAKYLPLSWVEAVVNWAIQGMCYKVGHGRWKPVEMERVRLTRA